MLGAGGRVHAEGHGADRRDGHHRPADLQRHVGIHPRVAELELEQRARDASGEQPRPRQQHESAMSQHHARRQLVRRHGGRRAGREVQREGAPVLVVGEAVARPVRPDEALGTRPAHVETRLVQEDREGHGGRGACLGNGTRRQGRLRGHFLDAAGGLGGEVVEVDGAVAR
jgi:hypothetical protein